MVTVAAVAAAVVVDIRDAGERAGGPTVAGSLHLEWCAHDRADTTRAACDFRRHQLGLQMDRHTNRERYILTYRQTDKQTDGWTDRHADRHADRRTDRHRSVPTESDCVRVQGPGRGGDAAGRPPGRQVRPGLFTEAAVARGDTCHSTLSLAVIDCHSLGIYAVVLLSLRSFSVEMTASPRARQRRKGHEGEALPRGTGPSTP
jgi:hypothetical protein